jgi:hypothetical protein
MRLRKYSDLTTAFEFDPISGRAEEIRFTTHREAQMFACGLADWVKVGLWSVHTCLAALYSCDDRLVFHCGSQSFDLADGRTRVERKSPFPGIKEFIVHSPRMGQHSWRYRRSDLFEDGYNIQDFLLYVSTVAASLETRIRFIAFWKQVAHGRDPNDPTFQEELVSTSRSLTKKFQGAALEPMKFPLRGE